MNASNEAPRQRQPGPLARPCDDCNDLRGKSFWLAPHPGQVALKQDQGNIVYRCNLCLSTLTCDSTEAARKWGDWRPAADTQGATGLH